MAGLKVNDEPVSGLDPAASLSFTQSAFLAFPLLPFVINSFRLVLIQTSHAGDYHHHPPNRINTHSVIFSHPSVWLLSSCRFAH